MIVIYLVPIVIFLLFILSVNQIIKINKKPNGMQLVKKSALFAMGFPIVFLCWLVLRAKLSYTGVCPYVGDYGFYNCKFMKYLVEYYLIGWAGIALIFNIVCIIVTYLIGLLLVLFVVSYRLHDLK